MTITLTLLALCLLGAPDDDGWVNLFDGKSLKGWKECEAKGSFTVKDGAIVVNAKKHGDKKARLYEKKREEEEAKMKAQYGEKKEIAWGSQIRSYVFHPYAMVKDHRTQHETSNTQAVMDGDLDDFIEAYLKQLAKKESGQSKK